MENTAGVQLLLSLDRSIRELQQQIDAEVGFVGGARVEASDRMEANLTGLGFKIEAVTPTEQLVRAGTVTEWKWQIEPTRPGTRVLDLTLSAIVRYKGDDSRVAVKTFERKLTVSAVSKPWNDQFADFLSDNWQWLWTALAVPIGAWIIRRRKRSTDSGVVKEHSTKT